MRDVIEIAIRIRIVEIDRWWQHLVAYGEDRKYRLDNACRAEQVPGTGLR